MIQNTPREFARHFIPENLDLGKWEDLEVYFQKLLSEDVSSREALESWMDKLSELSAALGEESSLRYIRMTCNTEDPDLEQAYLHYVQEIIPKSEPLYFELSKKFLASPALDELPQDRYEVYIRNRKQEVELFREENVALQTEDETLSQQYQKACGEQSAEFEGQERTIPQITKFLEETDRERRKAAWTAAISRQFADREMMETVFDKMIGIRHQMAKNAGFSDFIEFQFQRLGRFDYTPADCYKFHEAVEKQIIPLRKRLLEKRKAALGVDKLSPWDLQVDAEGRPPLRPYTTTNELMEGTRQIFAAVDPRFAADFQLMMDRQLLDLDSRKGKAPGGYQSTLDEARLPFIFMNAAGRNQDVFTLLHEGGHAFHALAYRQEPIHSYRNAPIEFCEVASMGMEMMASENLEALYTPADARRARLAHIEDTIMLLPWIMRVDAFQHWIYKNPSHTRQERAAQWLELEKRFGDELDWSVLPEWRECSWINKLHFFCVPLYYIEYGIAQLGALQLWVNYLADSDKAVTDYRAGLALGNSRPLPELFKRAGLNFQFDAEMLQPLASKLSHELEI